MLSKLVPAALAAAAAAVVVAPAASAAPAPVFTSYDACQAEGSRQQIAAGGPFSGFTFTCEKTYSVGAGTAGCPLPPRPTAASASTGSCAPATSEPAASPSDRDQDRWAFSSCRATERMCTSSGPSAKRRARAQA